MPISILDNTETTTFLKVIIAFSIHMSNKSVQAFPTRGQRALLAGLLHFDHGFSNSKTFEQVLAFPACIRASLLLLCLFYIEQDVLMYTCYELHLLQELCSNLLNINSVIHHSSQCTQIVVSSESW